MYNPYPNLQQPYTVLPFQQQAQFQQPVHGFVYVNGIEGAYAYQMPPNSEMPLFDSNVNGLMYIKTTDGAGYPSVQSVQFPVGDATDAQPVSHDDLHRMYKDIVSQLEQVKEAVYAIVPKAAGAAQPDAGAAAGGPAAAVPAAYQPEPAVRADRQAG